MKIKVLTSYKPGTWNEYAKRAVDSVLQHWPQDTQVAVYHEAQSQDVFEHPRVEWLDAHEVQPELLKFKNKYKDDPVANGEINEIPNGVRRPIPMAPKGSFLWNAVRFANKVFCVINAVRNSDGYDYVLWIDADTFTFRPVPLDFFSKLLPKETMLTYLGRENPTLGDGGVYPECGFVGYNLNHPETRNFINDWEQLYTTGDVFKILEWHDSYVFWHLSKIYRAEKNIQVNDIGYHKGVKGHHVFINSELGLYMDHFKGKRKLHGTSARNDFRVNPNASFDLQKIDYWKKVPPS